MFKRGVSPFEEYLPDGEFKRGVSPLSYKTLPPLLSKERGIKGVRLIDTILKEAKNQSWKLRREKVVMADLFIALLLVF